MQAVIMAGGRGSRLMPLTKSMPKPLVPILDKPIMCYILSLLKTHGIEDIIVTLGYEGDMIQRTFGDGSELGVRLRYVRESEPLGTAGGVKNAERYIDEDFVVISGDAYTDMDLSALVAFHRNRGGLVTVATHYEQDVSRFGSVLTDERGCITNFYEKVVQSPSNWVNTGVYVLQREVLDLIPKSKYDFALDLFPTLLGKMYALPCDCYWSDIGTLATYYLTNYEIVSQKARLIPV